jgi:GntR family transcriptional regulator, transcriptional repressor for pyruvate dehydrogenase complex
MAFKNVHRKRNLSHEVAASIRDAVFQGEYLEGSSIPSEPELSQQFGVSRAVVRDATRILEARGLIEIAQGKGMFVTPDATEAFEEVLLIALKKANANTADVDTALRMILPAACASIAANRNEKVLKEIEAESESYESLKKSGAEESKITAAYRKLLAHIFVNSGNKVTALMGPALLRLTRNRIGEADGNDFTGTILKAIQEEDGEKARARVRELVGRSSSSGLLAQAADLRQDEE